MEAVMGCSYCQPSLHPADNLKPWKGGVMDHLEGQPAVPSLVISWLQSKIYIHLGIQSVGVEINFLCPHRGLHDIQQMGVPFYMCVQFLSCVWLFASLPDSSVQGILQARILEQVAILSRKWKWKWSCSVMFDCFNPMDCSPQGSSTHGIFQTRVLEWVSISFSRGSSWSMDFIQRIFPTQGSNPPVYFLHW